MTPRRPTPTIVIDLGGCPFTPEEDSKIIELRRLGHPWGSIAAKLRCNERALVEHGRQCLDLGKPGGDRR